VFWNQFAPAKHVASDQFVSKATAYGFSGMNKLVLNMRIRGRFYLTRFKRASFFELAYRLRQACSCYRVGWMTRRGQMSCRIPAISLNMVQTLAMPEFHGQVDRSCVERIMAGFRFSLNVNHDAISQCELELRQLYRPSIRTIGSQVDIRAVWEPARLQHVTLLIAYLRQCPDAQDGRAIMEFVRDEILGWLADNRFPLGPHYLSAMECGLRLPVFFYALKVLDNLSNSDVETILKGIYLHAWWIEKNLSLFSSLGNHTVCEAMGLVFAGSVCRETEDGRRWLDTGLNLLVQELPHQVLDDGGPVEQAFGYHRFVLDIYWLAVDFLESSNPRSCDDFKARLLAGEGFLSSFGDTAGIIPSVGDYDDGHAIAPGLSPRRLIPTEQQLRCRTFRTSGYTVLRGNGETLLAFDHGPLGMAPLYNHGHADALSVTLSISDAAFLVDAGTYRYNGVPSLRRYFKGTKAHNTVVIDGLDQATQMNGFIWEEPFSGRLERAVETAAGMLIEASHDGYSRLKEPVLHIRSIQCAPNGAWVITDLFQGIGQHTFELNFHFHPEIIMKEQEIGWLAERNGHRIRVELSNGGFHLCRGKEGPLIGWFSPAYNLKVPSPVLQAVRNGTPAEVIFETRISIV
jgi:hypothetical protein